MLRTEFVIQTVLKALDTLCDQTDLSPHNEVINETLSHLVATLSAVYQETEEAGILADPRVQEARPRLLEKLSTAETEMEKYWADRFIEQDNLTMDDLETFWYWDNYTKLVDKELACLPEEFLEGDDGGEAVFIGAGALPLTAIIMHEKTGIPITCVDSDPEACRKAETLINKLGLTGMRVICADGGELNYNRYKAVMVASLVPQNAKEEIVDEIRNSKTESYILVRSAERLHTLLYESVDEDHDSLADCHFIDKTRHDPDVINTTLVYHSEAGRQSRETAPAGDNAPQPRAIGLG